MKYSIEEKMTSFAQAYGLHALRWSLGVIYVWFGWLKIIGQSPVEELLSRLLFWFPPQASLISLGVAEVIIGLGLLCRYFLRVTLLVFFLHMIGTFFVFPFVPELAFQNGNPLLLTAEGEFVLKNLVFLSAGLVLWGGLPVLKRRQGRNQKQGGGE